MCLPVLNIREYSSNYKPFWRAFVTYFMICHIKMSIGEKIDRSFETNDLKLGLFIQLMWKTFFLMVADKWK